MLSTAGSHPRDFAILQLFLQTGIRVSELVHLTMQDVDLSNKVIKVSGKGSKERTIPLEKKAVLAFKNYLSVRGTRVWTSSFFSTTPGPDCPGEAQKRSLRNIAGSPASPSGSPATRYDTRSGVIRQNRVCPRSS